MQSKPTIHTSVAIIGAGFSGTMTAVNLVSVLPAHAQMHITLIEKSDYFAQGAAYSTSDRYHFLNVMAKKMGAVAGDPEHFYRWLQSNEQIWKRVFPDLTVKPESFVPRRLYALYLDAQLQTAQKVAVEKGITLELLKGEAVQAAPIKDGQLKIVLQDGQIVIAESMVLATSLTFRRPCQIDFELPQGSYADSIWSPPTGSIVCCSTFTDCRPDARVVILGSGLTMVDAAVSLFQKGYKGEVVAISKHGHLPEPHLPEDVAKLPPPFHPKSLPHRFLELFQHVRQLVEANQHNGIDWRAVVDSLRPITIPLWENLPLEEKKRFVRHVLSYWDKVRHRIPPESYKILLERQKSGKLKIHAGGVQSIRPARKKPRLEVVCPASTIEVDYVLNCAGAEKNIQKNQSKILLSLLENKVIQAHPLNMGILVDQAYRVVGEHKLLVYALGQLIVGQKLETVAVPELREQCAHIAKEIASKLVSMHV